MKKSVDFRNLEWSEWFPITERKLPPQLANESGIYQVRRAGQGNSDYVGQTNCLRRRILSLRVSLKDEEMPWSDPHVASARFWALLQEKEDELEASVAFVADNPVIRKSYESLTIAHHRKKFGCSPTLNFGRLPRGWVASSQRSKGKRGYFDPRIVYSEHAAPRFLTESEPREIGWLGLAWEVVESGSNGGKGAGVYRAVEKDSKENLYIGESSQVFNRIRLHRNIKGAEWQWVETSDLDHSQRLEIENDLIASSISSTGHPPPYQFQNT